MKYISKHIQKYLTKENLKAYKSLCKQRTFFIKTSRPNPVVMYNKWAKRRWTGIPGRHSFYYIEDPNEKQIWKDYWNKIGFFCYKISKIEMSALEEKERITCKPGTMLKYISGRNDSDYRKGLRFLLEEKSDRDHYSLVSIGKHSSFKRSIWKWKWVVQKLEIEIEA